ncbi:MAG: ABC transporter ATP-binding protein [Hyphomonadaceae bacterium]
MTTVSDDVLIRVEGVSKRFCRDLKRSLFYGVQDTLADCIGTAGTDPKLRRDEFWAVDGVSLELRRGECLGLIGRNGAGKTTLLKMLSGLIKPDKGRIEIRGRVGALIALGAGFSPILSGRENIYVNGAVLGLSKREINEKVEEIIDFAEIGDFIDSPVQTYSSGMAVRLGFAIASAMEPDVLLLDEVLAVGDVAFRTKCYNRVEKLKSSAATILVSHQMADIARVCTRTLVRTDLGFVDASTSAGVQLYETSAHRGDGAGFVTAEPGFALIEANITPDALTWRSRVCAKIVFTSEIPLADAEARITFMSADEVVRAEWRSTNNRVPLSIETGVNHFEFDIGPILLAPGIYSVGFVISKPNFAQYLILSFKMSRLIVSGDVAGLSTYQLEGRSEPILKLEAP